MSSQSKLNEYVCNLKPELAKELNKDGLRPLDIASDNGDTDMVKALVKTDGSLCLLEGKEGKIPLHHAVIKGRVDVIKVLLSASADSVAKKTSGGETAVHLAVRNNQFEALEVLVDHLWKFNMEDDVLNQKDAHGNTILHIIALIYNFQVEELGHDNTPSERAEKVWNYIKYHKFNTYISSESRNSLMVIAVLIAAATYQAVLTPPGGVWQDDSASARRVAGSAIMADKVPMTFILFVLCNFVGFFMSLFIIDSLTDGFPMRFGLRISLFALSITYFTSAFTLGEAPPYFWIIPFIFIAIIFIIKFAVNVCVNTPPAAPMSPNQAIA